MPSLYTAFTSGLLFPLQERLKGHSTVTVRRRLEETQWWPADKLQALQVQRLRALLVDAGRHVPYYRETLPRLGLTPDSAQEK